MSKFILTEDNLRRIIRNVIYEAVVKNLNTEELPQMLDRLESLSVNDYQTMDPSSIWQVLIDLSIVNANAYKGMGLTDEQKDFNTRIYQAKNKVLSEIVPIINQSEYFKTNLEGDVLLIRNADGRQISFHIKGLDELKQLQFSDPTMEWDKVEKAFMYNDPQEYAFAKEVYAKYGPMKYNIVSEYTEKIKQAAIEVFTKNRTYYYLNIPIRAKYVLQAIKKMKPFVTNNPKLHTDISPKSLFGNERIPMDISKFGDIADKIARKMGYPDAVSVSNEITEKLIQVDNQIKSELSQFNQLKKVVEESVEKVILEII